MKKYRLEIEIEAAVDNTVFRDSPLERLRAMAEQAIARSNAFNAGKGMKARLIDFREVPTVEVH